MFDTLTSRLSDVFGKLTGKGALSGKDVEAALREIRRALLEADVALSVVRDLMEAVRTRALGHEVLKSVTPGQQVVKIVHDVLVETLGTQADPVSLQAAPPVVIMMVGLQGSGKTTTTAKMALRFQERDRQRVLMASLDTRRPAAQEQLRILGEQNTLATLPVIAGQQPVDIARRALEAGRLGGHDIIMLDTAGRLHVDEALMNEVSRVHEVVHPHETLLVADSLTGQDALHVATHFRERMNVTGIVLTRMDGDGRGGAALSMRAATGVAIKALGTGEKMHDLEDFDPRRVAGRILGQGDIVSLVEKASETIDAEKARKIAKKMKKGHFDLDDMAEQLRQMNRMGGIQGLLGMMPGMGKMKKQIDASQVDESVFRHQGAIISSMTRAERKNPKLLNASRKKRISAGSGTSVPEINRLLKIHRQMTDMMKKMGKSGKLFGDLGGAADLAAMPDLQGSPLSPGPGIGSNAIAGGGLPGLGSPALPGLPAGRGGKRK